MQYSIAIPSHKRAELLCKKTLNFLKSSEFPIENIYLFINPPEVSEYTDVLLKFHPDYLPQIIEGGAGTTGQRQKIEEYFFGKKVLCIDDDVKNLKMLHPLPLVDLIHKCFEIAERENCSLWGFQPTDNKLWLTDSADVGLKYCIGAMFGMHCRYKLNYDLDLMEDFHRTLEYFKRDGRVLRFNSIGIATTYFGKGGLEDFRKGNSQLIAATEFHNKNPTLCRLRVRDGKPPDVCIKSQIQKKIPHPFQ